MKKRDVQTVARIQRRHQVRLTRRRQNRRLGLIGNGSERRPPRSMIDDVAALLGVIDRLRGAA